MSDSAPRSSSPARATTSGTAWPVCDETVTFHDVLLECGRCVKQVDVRYRLEGTFNAARDNVVLVVHALTGTTHASEWWKGVIGTNAAIDPARHAVLCANLLGGCDGTTGPSDDNPDALPPFSTRDQAALLARLLDALDVHAPLLVCGGSLGGMVTLEFAASFPARVRSAVVLAAPAAQTAQGIAWNAIMRRAIAVGGGRDGLALARMVAMLSYRTPEGLEKRFGRLRSEHDTFQVRDWLHVHGEKLVARFDATSYGALIDAMDGHDVGRGRGGLSAALSAVGDRLIGVGIAGDLLYPADRVREWTTAATATYVELPSMHGHDAFLLEIDRVSAVIAKAITNSELRADTAAASATDAPGTVTADTPHLRPLRVALAGCGQVGGSLLELLGERAQHLGDAQPIRVNRVLVRHAERPRPALAQAIARGIAQPDACITDPALLLDDDIDVLVEAIGGTTTARTLVEIALRRGIRVVTANTALLGQRGPALAALARITDTRLDFEGAVCGAIPIVRCVRSGAAGVGITKVSGILNGASNFVLQKVAEGTSRSDAVATLQRLGYVQADPARDRSGQDAEDTLRILAWMCFGVDPATLTVTHRGIDVKTAAWVTPVALEGDRGKPIAGRILPTRITGDDPWARVAGPFNRIVVDSVTAGSLVFEGPGAGGRATAGAMLADIVAE